MGTLRLQARREAESVKNGFDGREVAVEVGGHRSGVVCVSTRDAVGKGLLKAVEERVDNHDEEKRGEGASLSDPGGYAESGVGVSPGGDDTPVIVVGGFDTDEKILGDAGKSRFKIEENNGASVGGEADFHGFEIDVNHAGREGTTVEEPSLDVGNPVREDGFPVEACSVGNQAVFTMREGGVLARELDGFAILSLSAGPPGKAAKKAEVELVVVGGPIVARLTKDVFRVRSR